MLQQVRQLLALIIVERGDHAATSTDMRIRQSFTAQALTDERVATRLRHAYAQLNARLADLLAHEIEVGAITASERPEHVAGRLVAFAEGLAYHVLIGTHLADVARRQVVDAVGAQPVSTRADTQAADFLLAQGTLIRPDSPAS